MVPYSLEDYSLSCTQPFEFCKPTELLPSFSGIVGVQCLVYYKLYPEDHPLKKIMVRPPFRRFNPRLERIGCRRMVPWPHSLLFHMCRTRWLFHTPLWQSFSYRSDCLVLCSLLVAKLTCSDCRPRSVGVRMNLLRDLCIPCLSIAYSYRLS